MKAKPRPVVHRHPRVVARSRLTSSTSRVSRRVHKSISEHNTRVSVHDRTVRRSQEWSHAARHEQHWSRTGWATHRFASYHSNGVNSGYHFDHQWWNNYVTNPGTVSWNRTVVATPGSPPPAVAPPVVKVSEGLPVSGGGAALAKLLDGLQVESHWLPGQKVDWRTGTPVESGVPGPASNGGAFVAAVCDRLGAPLPTFEAADFLPANQHDWLLSSGKNKGWAKVGEVEAQVLANQGWAVVAIWQNLAPASERTVAGLAAVVRPDNAPSSELAQRGPRVAMAGLENHNNIAIKDGFPAAAWREQEIVYLAHRARY